MRIDSTKDLEVYKKAYSLVMEIFELSRGFPKGERYSLTDQIRRSSRSVCLNLREAWAKRRCSRRDGFAGSAFCQQAK